jgi:putative addiction module killer protein
VFTIRQTKVFEDWLDYLADRTGQKRIAARIVRIQSGNFGDVKSVGGKASELRVDVGPGYRVYFTRHGRQVILLLCGGDKSSQLNDIARAQEMVVQLNRKDG